MSTPPDISPCIACGACCAAFHVRFSVYELVSAGGTVPDELAIPVDGTRCDMRGTHVVPIHCINLAGTVGQEVSCTMYHDRPSPCRELTLGSYACNKARERHGLVPITE